MNRLSTKLFIASTLFAVLGTTQANANDYLRIKSDAKKIERKATSLSRETSHYRATPQYLQVVCDVEQFILLSQHVTDLVAQGGSIRNIKSDVNQLNATFHHVEGLFDTIEYNAANGIGVKKGNTAHVKRLLNSIEECIFRMQEDLAILQVRARQAAKLRRVATQKPIVVAQRPVVNAPRPVVTRPSNYYGRGSKTYSSDYRPPSPQYRPATKYKNPRGSGVGLTIGGGSSRLHVRF